VLVDVLSGRVSGAACTTWAAGHAGGERERADRLSGGGWCASCVWPVLQAHDNRQANWGKKGWAGSLTCQGPFDELPVVIDQPGKQPQVHDRAIARGRGINDLADGGGVPVSGKDEGAGLDLAGVAGLVQEVRLPASAATAYRPRCRGDEVPVGAIWSRSRLALGPTGAGPGSPCGHHRGASWPAHLAGLLSLRAIRRSTPGWPAALSTALEVAMTCVPLTSDDSQPQEWSVGNPAVIAV
jgi:hypothetical protein